MQLIGCFMLPYKQAILVWLILLINACSVYKPDITQGNIVTSAQVASLKKGISRQQVQQIMGSPLLQDVFNGNRWDYIYRHLKSNQTFDQRVMTLFFDANGNLERWSGEVAPDQNQNGFTPASLLLISPVTEIDTANAPLSLDSIGFDKNNNISPNSNIIADSPANINNETDSLFLQAKSNSALFPDVVTIIGEKIDAWRSAWRSKNLSLYSAHYMTDYKGVFSNRRRWLAQRQYILATPGDISITLSNIRVIQTSSTEARAEFTQTYQSARLTETGVKNLYFQRLNDVWSIASERFIKRI
jgi:outer membrane protein assembly factor BamE